MKRMAGCALALALTGGCAPGGELSPTPTPVRAQSAAFVAAPTKCGPAKLGSLREVLPDAEITGALELDVEHLRRGTLFPELEKLLAAEKPEVLAGMADCGVPLSKVQGLVFGFSERDDMVFGMRAEGLGDPATLDCLAGKYEKINGKVPWTRLSGTCETTLDVEGDAKGFVVGRDMVVIASKSLETAVGRRVAGKDRSALDGRLAWARKEVDMASTGWVATNVSRSTASALGSSSESGKPSPMSALSRVGVSFDATKGLGLRVGAGFSSAADAKAAAKELETHLVQLKAMLPLVGLPASVGDTIEIKPKGSVLELGMFLQLSDLEALHKLATGGSGSAGSGGASAPPPRRPGM